MSTPFNPIRPSKSEGDLTKRIVRTISEVVRQLDDARGRAQSIDQLFLPSFEVLRSKLHELCYRLILIDPLIHGKRAEDTLWKKGYHDVFTTAKRLRKGPSWCPEEGSQVRGLLVSGMGYYNHLLLKLQADHALQLDQVQDFTLFVADHGLSKGKGSPSRLEEAPWARALSARVMICLGDLARYLRDLEPGWDPGLAERFYRQAVAVDPTQGRPHNQLGTLAGNQNYGVDAAFHYLRSLNSSEPFPGALGNLSNVVERAAAQLDSAVPVIKLVSSVLQAVGSFYCDKTIDLPAVTTQVLEKFQACVQASISGSARPDFTDWDVPPSENPKELLTPDLTLKVMTILMMCADKHSETDQWQWACGLLIPCIAHLVQVLAPRRIGRPRRRRRGRRSSEASDSASSESGNSAASESSEDENSTHDIGAVSLDDELLPSLYVSLCWLSSHSSPLAEYADSQPFCRTLITLLNSVANQCFDISESEVNVIPLREDIQLRGLLALRSIHEDIDWTRIEARPLSEEAELRARRLLFVAQKLSELQFDTQLREFTIQQPVAGRCKGELMKHMGQLWLEAEVRELETRTRRAPPGLSPYLVVDAEALVAHASLVRHLVGSRQFVIVIPAVVLAILDDWKRESGRSRESIRWLESQFQRGNRSLRAQKAHERLSLPLIKYPKKKEKDIWNLFQTMECCYYLSKQSSLLVTFLTGVQDLRTPAFSPSGVANTFGVSVEHIEAFYNRWKTSGISAT